MISIPTRLRQVAVAGVLGAALAVAGIALPAQAATNFGAVAYSSFSASQSAGVVTYEFDYAPIDPLVPGTIEISIDNYLACANPTNVTIEYDVSASGHVQFSQSVASNAYSSVTISGTDGASLVFGQTSRVQDNAGYWGAGSTIVPDAADPSTGYIQVQTGNDRWETNYTIDLDGLTGGVQTLPGCGVTSVPFSALPEGSTLTVSDTDHGVVLTSYTNPVIATAAPVAVTPAATGTGSLNTLALTGFDGTPFAISGGIALTLGVGFLLWSKRRIASRAHEAS